MRTRLGAVIALAALSAGCGTTVATGGAPTAGGDGLTVPPAGASGPQGPQDGPVVNDPAAPGQSVRPAEGTQRPSMPTAAGSRPTASSTAVRGVTATTIRIGVAYQANIDAANKALGGDKITTGDQAANTNILVRDINARGGIAGRRVLVDFFTYDAQSAQPYAAQDQAACAHFTQDVAVLAVIGAGLTDTFQQCMENAGILNLGADIVRFSAADLRRYPHFFDVQELDLDRLVVALGAELLQHGWAAPWDARLGRPGTGKVKVGVVAFDRPRFATAVRSGLVPALRRGGLEVSDSNVVLIAEPSSQGDLGPAATQVQSAVLRFGQAGVTHVVLLDTHGGITQVFLNVAQTQGYRPRYGMGSGSGTQALLDGGIIAPEQLAGARGLGWIPMLDLPATANPDSGPWSSADRRRCLALMRAGGQAFTSTNAASIALLYCDQLWLVERALAGSSVVSTAAARAGIEAIGGRAPNASLGAASYGPGKHVAPSRGVEWAFDDTCSCMTYGRTRTIR